MVNDKNHKSKESKERLKWSYELQNRFIDAVNQLGGRESSVSIFFVLLKTLNQGIKKCLWFGLMHIS